MADTYTVVGDGDVVFGTGDAGGPVCGEIQSAGREKGGEVLELKNEKGNTYCVIFFDEKDECELEAIWDNDYTPPARGDLIDLMGLEDLVVQSFSFKWGNKEEKKISIKAIKYTALVTA